MSTGSSRGRAIRFALCVGTGLAVSCLPPPQGLEVQAWQIFAIFVGVIAGFLLRPLDMAPIVLIGLLVLIVSRSLEGTGVVEHKTGESISWLIKAGFGNKTVWLVVFAFLIADAVEKTGLGRRIALLLLAALGRSLTGLAYAVSLTDLALAPFIPSNTARGGGIVAPVVENLAKTLGSIPHESPERGGAYLVQVGSHTNLVTSAMFLTAMAGNALLPQAAEIVLGPSERSFGFDTWLRGAIVPGVVSLAFLPLVMRLVERPRNVDVQAARKGVAQDLAALGRPKAEEVRLAGVLIALLLLWSLQTTYHTTTVAMAGVLLLIVGGIRSWRDIAACSRAWDALIWLGGFVALAQALKASGCTAWFAGNVADRVQNFDPVAAAVSLAVVYFVSMYFFSQLTAHIAALAGAFFTASLTTGSPPLLMVALIAYFSNLCGATTPWSSGPVIIYFGQGYVSVGRWMRNGLVIAVYHLVVWLTVGMAWWKYLGWW